MAVMAKFWTPETYFSFFSFFFFETYIKRVLFVGEQDSSRTSQSPCRHPSPVTPPRCPFPLPRLGQNQQQGCRPRGGGCYSRASGTQASLPIPWAMTSSMFFPFTSLTTLWSRSSSASMPTLSRIFWTSWALREELPPSERGQETGGTTAWSPGEEASCVRPLRP